MRQLKKKENEKKKERDFKVKTQKSNLEWKKNPKDSWAERTKEWKVSNQEASEGSMRSLIPFETRKSESSIQDYHNESRRLIKSSYSGTGKMNLLRCLIFKEFLFLEKRPWKCDTHFSTKLWK